MVIVGAGRSLELPRLRGFVHGPLKLTIAVACS